MRHFFVLLMLVFSLTLVACGGDDAGEDDDAATAANPTLDPNAEPTITPTVDTSIDLPPEVTLDPARLNEDLIVVSPRPRTPTLAIERESTLPPAALQPTNTVVVTRVRPTDTPTPRDSPTPTEPVPVGSCEGFGYDTDVIGEISEIEREQSFELGWQAPLDAQNVSYEVRVFNSNAGQIFQSATTATRFTLPERVTTNRRADGQLLWQVDVFSNGVLLGCDPIIGEARFTTSP